MAKSQAEETLAVQLRAAGVEFEREFRFHPTRKWRADFRIVGHPLLIEVEGVGYTKTGGTRHQSGRGYEEDCIKYNSALQQGYCVLRFTPDMVRGRARGARKSKQPPAIAVILDVLHR